jgi:CBS domain-containing protein
MCRLPEDREMKVKDVMTEGVECLQPTDSIAQAAEKMRDLDVGSLPVCGDQDKLVGIVTDRDITIRSTARAGDPHTTPVSAVMTPDIVFCFDDQDATEAAELMEARQIRRLVVLNRNKRLVGIVSLGDLAVRVADDQLSGEALERVSEPAEAVR